jgi:CrcB protein
MVWYIAAGGIVGTLSRYYLQGWVQARVWPAGFPTGTLAVNLIGSFAIGFIIRLATGSMVVSPDVRAGLTIGFCGAFTTMSTFSYESMKLLADGEYWYAGLYMGGTIVGCLAAVIAGTALASKLL